MMSMRVSKRFYGMSDLPHLRAGIPRDFKAKWGQNLTFGKYTRDAGCRKYPSRLRD